MGRSLLNQITIRVCKLANYDLTATEGKSLRAVRQNIPVETTILMCFTLYLCLQETQNI